MKFQANGHNNKKQVAEVVYEDINRSLGKSFWNTNMDIHSKDVLIPDRTEIAQTSK